MGTVSTTTITSDTETITRTKLNGLVANLLTEFNGSIDNDNIKASAGIVASKLDLTSPGAIGSTAANSGAFTTLTASGATTLNGNTIIGNASGDALTIHPAAWTLSNAVTITGTWTDLGTVTTADINGGTIDGVTIGATSAPTVTNLGSVATCDINGGTIDGVTIGGAATRTVTDLTMSIGSDADGDIYYRSSNKLTRLAKGTASQVLRMNSGATAPEWATSNPASPIVFSWGHFQGANADTSGNGAVLTSTTEPTGSTNGQLGDSYVFGDQVTYQTCLTLRYWKLPEHNTITCHFHSIDKDSGGNNAFVQFDIGGQTAEQEISSTSYSWYSVAVDVSVLSDDTAYDVDINIKHEGSAIVPIKGYIYGVAS